jgi:hypothetical protein
MDDAAGEAGSNAVVGRAGRSPPPALNQLTTGIAKRITAPTTMAAGNSTIKRLRRGGRRGSEEAARIGGGGGVAGGGGVGVTAVLDGGDQSRWREQLEHQLSIA